MIAIAAPLVAIAVRSRPPGRARLTVAQAAETLPGYEVWPALHTRSFWMITAANFCFGFAATGTAIHMVTHLEHVGYSAANAALAMSFIFGFAAIGKVVMGLLADRLTARRALAIDFVNPGRRHRPGLRHSARRRGAASSSRFTDDGGRAV